MTVHENARSLSPVEADRDGGGPPGGPRCPFSDPRALFADLARARSRPGLTLAGDDNPDHDRLRSGVNAFFMPRRLVRYESWIESAAHELIETVTGGGLCRG